MGTITVRIKKNPQLCDIVTDAAELYFEYTTTDSESDSVSIPAKVAKDVVAFGKSHRTKPDSASDSSDNARNESIVIEATEDSSFHVCFVDGSYNLNDVEVTRMVFLEYLEFQLEDERTRWEYREYCNLFSDGTVLESKRADIDVPLDEVITRRDSLHKLHIALGSLTALQRRRLLQHYVQGKTVREIGKDEHRHYTCVDKSILKAVNALKKKLEGD